MEGESRILHHAAAPDKCVVGVLLKETIEQVKCKSCFAGAGGSDDLDGIPRCERFGTYGEASWRCGGTGRGRLWGINV